MLESDERDVMLEIMKPVIITISTCVREMIVGPAVFLFVENLFCSTLKIVSGQSWSTKVKGTLFF